MRASNFLLITLTLLLAIDVSTASAEGQNTSALTPSHTMTPQEYETYRAQLHRQIEQANPSPQNNAEKPTDENSSALPTDDKTRSGYGQGYRARAERNASRMDSRGASHRGGGRGR
ncbi:MAG: hypothetical protein PHP57_04855 [Sideroxydans sp.]|nr:hypothetical protein [Sideroxydans sp.]